ncbi:glycosyltransferase [Spirillospora sp. CA-294931]|uniref:glycosyltransferase n=1 Tax=Spirillospora sp. CA-294931 TaxID=3240042 RepID=UPI003D8DAE26
MSVRVLHVAQPTVGGVAGYVGRAAADQLARGWAVAVACPLDGELAGRLGPDGVPHFPWEAGRSPGVGTLGETRRLRRIVREFAPGVVHLHSAKAGLAGRLAPGGPGVIFQPHGWSWHAGGALMGAVSRRWERFAARRCDALVCCGEGELRQGVDAGVEGKLALVRNGVDLRRFRPVDRRAARRALGLDERAPLAVCVGRLTRQKGQDVLLAAWPRVRARCPEARLALVGDGEDLPRLRGLAGPGVTFVPGTDDPGAWFGAADVVAVPSRWEGLALVVLEALASGRSVVASAIPGLAEAVPPGAGVLVPAEAPAELAGALAVRLSSPALAEVEGRAGAAASAGFDVEETLDRLAELTRAVAERRSAITMNGAQ